MKPLPIGIQSFAKLRNKGACETLLNAAFAQITCAARSASKKNRYHERYAGENRRIAFLAVAFTGKKIACRMEEYNLSTSISTE